MPKAMQAEPAHRPELVLVQSADQQQPEWQQAPWWEWSLAPHGQMDHKCLACSSKYKAKWATSAHLSTQDHAKRVAYFCWGYNPDGSDAKLWDAASSSKDRVSMKVNTAYKWTDSPEATPVDGLDARAAWPAPQPAGAPPGLAPASSASASSPTAPTPSPQAPHGPNPRVVAKIDEVAVQMKSKMDDVLHGLQTWEQAMTDIQTSQQAMATMVVAMNTKMDGLFARMETHESTLVEMNAKMDGLLTKMEAKLAEFTVAGSATTAARSVSRRRQKQTPPQADGGASAADGTA